jgi:hypothetical protein
VNTIPAPDPADGQPLRLEIFDLGAGSIYDSARKSAAALVQTRPGLRLEAWNIFDPGFDWAVTGKDIQSFPTVRLYRGEELLAQSTLGQWTTAHWERWIEASLKL